MWWGRTGARPGALPRTRLPFASGWRAKRRLLHRHGCPGDAVARHSRRWARPCLLDDTRPHESAHPFRCRSWQDTGQSKKTF